MKSSYVWFLSGIMAQAVYLKSRCHTWVHLGFLLCCFPRGFIVLCFAFKSVIRFELNLWRLCLFNRFFFFSHTDIQLFQPHLLKILSLRHTAFAPLSQVTWLYFVGLPALPPVTHCLVCCGSAAEDRSWALSSVSPPALPFYADSELAVLALWPLHINFRICLSVSTK